MWIALAIFVFTYLFMSGWRHPFLPLDRPSAALAGAVLMVVAGVLPLEDAYRVVDWNTIVLLLGMMIVTAYLKSAGFFGLVAEAVVRRVRSPVALLAAVV